MKSLGFIFYLCVCSRLRMLKHVLSCTFLYNEKTIALFPHLPIHLRVLRFLQVCAFTRVGRHCRSRGFRTNRHGRFETTAKRENVESKRQCGHLHHW